PGRLVPKTHVRPIQHGVRAARRRRPPELPGPRSRDPRQHVLDRQAERVTASRDGRPYVHQFLRRTPVRLIRGSWPFGGSVLSTARRIDCPVCAVGQRTWLFRLTSLKMSQQMASPSIRTTLDTWAKLSIRYSETELGIVTFCVKKGRSRFGEGICAVVLVVLSGAAATIARPPTPTLICSALVYVLSLYLIAVPSGVVSTFRAGSPRISTEPTRRTRSSYMFPICSSLPFSTPCLTPPAPRWRPQRPRIPPWLSCRNARGAPVPSWRGLPASDPGRRPTRS